MDECNDSLALLGHANRQLNMTRRDIIKPELRYEYLHLCAQSVPYTAWVFDDGIFKSANEIEDCSKISHKLQYSNRGGTFTGRMRGRFRGRRPRGRGNYCIHQVMDIQKEVGELDNHIQKSPERALPTESSAEKQDTIENEISSLEFNAGRLKYFR